MDGRVCTRCHVWKSAVEFVANKRRPGGIGNECKLCKRERSRGEYWADRDRIRARRVELNSIDPERMRQWRRLPEQRARMSAYNLRYRAGKEEQLKDYVRRWREEHPEYTSHYHAQNRERRKEQARRWHQRNPLRSKAITDRRRARQYASEGSYTPSEWEELCAHYEYCCLACWRQEPEITLTADHIVPISKGGSSFISNIQPLCRECNGRKKDRYIDFRPEFS